MICLSMNFFKEGFLFVRTEQPDYTPGMSILKSILEGDIFSAKVFEKESFIVNVTGLAMVRRASRRFRLLSSALRNGLKTESLKELSYVINNRAIYTRKNKTRLT